MCRNRIYTKKTKRIVSLKRSEMCPFWDIMYYRKIVSNQLKRGATDKLQKD